MNKWPVQLHTFPSELRSFWVAAFPLSLVFWRWQRLFFLHFTVLASCLSLIRIRHIAVALITAVRIMK